MSFNPVSRRVFINLSSAGILCALATRPLRALPSLAAFIENEQVSPDREELRLLLVEAVAAQTYQEISFNENFTAFRANFHAVFSARDFDGNYSVETIEKITKASPVTLDDLYKACNYKESTLIEDAFPKLNSMFQSAVIGVGTASLASAGTATLPTVLAGITFLGVEVVNSALIEGLFEKIKKDNADLCKKTALGYYSASREQREVLRSEPFVKNTKIQFAAQSTDLREKLPNGHPVRVITERTPNHDANQEIITAVLNDLNSYLAEWRAASVHATTIKKRQDFLNELDHLNGEISGALFVAQAVIRVIAGNEKLANDFYKVSMAVKEMYIAYAKYTMPEPAIGAAALSATWASAGLTILSSFSQSGDKELWGNLFKQLKVLTDLIIDGFNAVLENQRTIINQLNAISEAISKNAKIEQSMLRRLADDVDLLRSRVDLMEYNSSIWPVIDASAQLNTLVQEKQFDPTKPEFIIEFNKYITRFVTYATETACVSGSISGFSVATRGIALRKVVRENIPFEYQIGLIPIAAASLATPLKYLTNTFTARVPNPIEWNRGVDLYLQANLIVNPASKYVSTHFAQFINTGEKLQSMLQEFTNPALIEELADSQASLAGSASETFVKHFSAQLVAKNYHSHLWPYRKFLKLEFSNLNRDAFRQVVPGPPDPRSGTQAQRVARRKMYRDEMERTFRRHPRAVVFDELDTYDSYPEHRIFAISEDVFDIFEIARDLGVISLTSSTWRSTSSINPTSFTVWRCEFILGHFSGIAFNFCHQRTQFHYSAESPFQGKEYYTFNFDGTQGTRLNQSSWRAQVKSVMKEKKIGRDYFKLRKLNENEDIINYSVIEFIINEILHKADAVKKAMISASPLDIDALYLKNANHSNEIDTAGYLATNILTISNYNKSASPYSDYRELALGRYPYTHYLTYPPFYAFFDDLAKLFLRALEVDVINETLHGAEWAAYRNTFNTQPEDLTPLFRFVVDRYNAIIEKQRSYLKGIDGRSSMNYNIQSTLNCLKQFKVHIDRRL